MTEWLSFWNANQRRKESDLVGERFGEVWIPWATGKVEKGDRVFVVGIEDGRLLLMTDLLADSVTASNPGREEVTITSRRSRAKIAFDRFVPDKVVDGLRFYKADESEDRFARDARGRLRGNQFQGRASLRKLHPASAALLDRVPNGSGRRRVVDIPPEDTHVEGYDITPGGASRAKRREARLQKDFVAFLQLRGDEVGAKKIPVPGERGHLYCDLFNRSRDQLIEVKANTTRDSIRMAIGQLADYGRSIPGARRAVLLPEKPSNDLLDLLSSQDAAAIWRSGGGFIDSAGGAFT